MEKINFDNWRNKREQQVTEGVMDWFRKKKPAAPTAPVPEGPTAPKEIYTNPTVIEHTQEILNLLGIKAGIESLNGKGEVTGTLPAVPPDFIKTVQRFVAGHLYGDGDNNKRSFLWISYHDAAQIVDFLDTHRKPGSHKTLAEEQRIESPNSLTIWAQTKLPISQHARVQDGFISSSDSYSKSKKSQGMGRPNLLDYPELIEVARAVIDVINTANRRKDISSTSKLRMPLEKLIQATQKAFPGETTIASLSLNPLPTPAPGGPTSPDPGDRNGTAGTPI